MSVIWHYIKFVSLTLLKATLSFMQAPAREHGNATKIKVHLKKNCRFSQTWVIVVQFHPQKIKKKADCTWTPSKSPLQKFSLIRQEINNYKLPSSLTYLCIWNATFHSSDIIFYFWQVLIIWNFLITKIAQYCC